jgi:hypothetical protein
MELLLSQPDIDDEDDEQTKKINITTPLFSPNGQFISFRQFRQQRFQPNPTVGKKGTLNFKKGFFL